MLLISPLFSCCLLFFIFFRTLSLTLILDKRYMCCSMKIKNISPYKYIAYSLASYYLSIIRSGIWWIKSGDWSHNLVFVFAFTIIFCYQVKCLLVASSFLKIGKTIVSNWYQHLHDKLKRKCVGSFLESVNSWLKLTF